MHVSMGGKTLDDGTFPPEDVCAYYDSTGKVPQTSASSPADFERVFDEIHAAQPEAKILHLAYSAVTTCSFQSAQLAAEGRDYVVSVDTQHVSVGQAAVVIEVAKWLQTHPEATVQQAADAARAIAARCQMCFIPKNLDYLRAGGRVSNAAALVGNLLGLHPCIEIIDGRLMAKKKYRGALDKISPKVVRDFVEKHDPDREHIYLIWSPGLSDASKAVVEQAVKAEGFSSTHWMKTGCVITCHGGPGCFGLVAFCKE
jgi:DegV family protein with EDD domain